MLTFLLAVLAGTPPQASPADPAPPNGHHQPAPSSPPPQENTAAPNIVISVDGMVCSFCVQGVERTMQRIEAVNQVALSLEAKTISLWLNPGQNVEDQFLRDQIKASGFDARDIVRSEPATN